MHDFTLNREDFAALMQQLNGNIAPKHAVFSVAFAMRVALWTALAYSFNAYFKAYDLATAANLHLTHFAVGTVIAVLLAALMYGLNARRVTSRLLADNGWFLGPQSMEFHEAGIEHQSRLGLASFRWQAFIKLTEDADRFFLLVEPGQGFVVPKRILTNPGLQELIRSKVPG